MLKNDEKTITADTVYPDLTPGEAAEAAENLVRYLGVVKRIFDRVSREDPKALTEFETRASLKESKEKTA